MSPSTALGQAGMQMFPMSPSGQTGRPLPSSLKNYGPASGVLASARSALGDAAVRPQPGRRLALCVCVRVDVYHRSGARAALSWKGV